MGPHTLLLHSFPSRTTRTYESGASPDAGTFGRFFPRSRFTCITRSDSTEGKRHSMFRAADTRSLIGCLPFNSTMCRGRTIAHQAESRRIFSRSPTVTLSRFQFAPNRDKVDGFCSFTLLLQERETTKPSLRPLVTRVTG